MKLEQIQIMMENLINGKNLKLIIINLFLIFLTTNLHAAWLGVQLGKLDDNQIKKYSFNGIFKNKKII